MINITRSSGNKNWLLVGTIFISVIGLPNNLHGLNNDNPTAVIPIVADKVDIDFTATTLNAETFHGRSLLGKIVLIDFFAIWCGPCLEAFPVLNKLNEDLKKENFEVVGVAIYSGTIEDVKDILSNHDPRYNIYIGDDDEIVRKYGVIGFPTYVLFSPEGKIVKKYVGSREDFYETVAKDIRDLRNKSILTGK